MYRLDWGSVCAICLISMRDISSARSLRTVPYSHDGARLMRY